MGVRAVSGEGQSPPTRDFPSEQTFHLGTLPSQLRAKPGNFKGLSSGNSKTMWTPPDGSTRPFHLPALPPLPSATLTSFIHSGFGLIQNRQFFKNLLTAIVLLISSGRTDGTCNEEQVEICRESALDGRLASLRSGGLCSPKPYAEFSHLCSVTNYLPSVEYCCCIYETNVLCCRYHQDWNLFRCQLEEDLIDTTTGSVDLLDVEGDDQSSLCCPPLELLLPAILVPLVVIVCCLYVCFKYWAGGGGLCGSEGLCSTQADDDATNISPRKNRRTNGVAGGGGGGDIALSASLTNSDANSTLPLTCSTTNHIHPPDKPGPYPRSDRSEETDQPPYDLIYPAPHRFFPVEPTAPPLFDDVEASSCAFSHCYHEPQESPDDFYTTPARHRDAGGRALPLYRNGRNFTSGGRCSAPLVHRITPGHYHFRSKYDRSAACRIASCPIRACSASPPPPPSYEQSCNQNL